MLTHAKIATAALLSLIFSGCCTTAHLDIPIPDKPQLPVITAEQENAIDAETWLTLQERELIIKAYLNRLLRSVERHNEINQ